METVTESMGFSPLTVNCTQGQLNLCLQREMWDFLVLSPGCKHSCWLLCKAKGNFLCWLRAERACVHSSNHICGVECSASFLQLLL